MRDFFFDTANVDFIKSTMDKIIPYLNRGQILVFHDLTISRFHNLASLCKNIEGFIN